MRTSAGINHSNARSGSLTNGFGVYVHIPFCVHKCSYCDFYSFTRYGDSDFEPLGRLIVAEVSQGAADLAAKGWQRPLTSIFFGGGTPSLFPVSLIRQIINTILELFPASGSVEITLEANPETITPELASEVLENTPVNRVSLGAQSFSSESLAKLERLGSRESICSAVHRLRGAGCRNLSLDLIFGIPGQGIAEVICDVDEAAQLAPDHISAYNLTLKPAHPLYRGLPGNDEAAVLFETVRDRLAIHGYEQYEVSNFSIAGRECRHNLLYWDGGDFLGVGPSASSRIFMNGVFHHRKQVADVLLYAKEGVSRWAWESNTAGQTILEAAFLELRKRDGVSLSQFLSRYGHQLDASPNFSIYMKEKLVIRAGDRLMLTPRGLMLADSVTQGLV